MERMIKTLAMAAAVVLFLTTGCTEESTEVVPEETLPGPAPDSEIRAQAPQDAEAGPSGDEQVNTAELPFPRKKSANNARTTAYGVTDYVDFNDKMALTIIPDNARNTFTYWPFYIQQVGNAWIHVKENNGAGYNPAFTSNYNHYHLSYENFLPCFMSSGQFGKPQGGGCVNFDPTQEPRILNTHTGDHWIKIYAYDYDSSQRVFDLLGIKVTNGPIQLWFKKNGGGWAYWSSLGEGTWNTSAYSTNITQILISGTGSSSIGFDNVKVKVPYH